MRIKRIINNNILCVIDEKGGESIVTGRGLGFRCPLGTLLLLAQCELVELL